LLDRGLELRTEPSLTQGGLESSIAYTFQRQQQDTEYGPLSRLSRTLSDIALNRLEARLLWSPAADSLLARGAVELRRRDTDFTGPVRRDPDYMDQARREGHLRWSHALGGGSLVALEGGLTLAIERHQQSSRSRANYLNRTWRSAAEHRLALGDWRLAGRGVLVADYRLYDFDDPLQPRSWIQRRLLLTERARHPLPVPDRLDGWRLAGELGGRWMEEDGGSFLRQDGRERLSDSAQEWQAGGALEGRRGRWTLKPGWDWVERRDWRWSAAEGRRTSHLVRHLRRQGPLLAVQRVAPGGRLALNLQWEWVRDGAGETVRSRRNVWGRLDWSWHGR
jgi:hypothetical protein